MSSSLHPSQINAFAEELDSAASLAKPLPQLTVRQPFGIGDAYRIQQASVQRRVERGEHIIGVKMGFTSQAKMSQMGVADQILGRLTTSMQMKDGASISLDAFIHPRCEPEVAFLLKKDLGARVTLEEALDAIGCIAPAIDIIDSRYAQFRFSLADVVADNASSAAFVLGPWLEPFAEIAALDTVLAINAQIRQRGSTGDILGNPMLALLSAARLTASQGFPLKKGMIVLAGAATAAEPLAPGMHVHASIAHLGDVHFSIVPDNAS